MENRVESSRIFLRKNQNVCPLRLVEILMNPVKNVKKIKNKIESLAKKTKKYGQSWRKL